MVSSLDGAISVRGRSGVLGGPPDRRLFMALRSLADVIVVGAGTMRTEGYGPARLDDELRAGRQARGQPAEPPIAVITRSCHFDWQSPFFTEATARPIVFTIDDAVQAPGSRGTEVADIVAVGETEVDLRRVLTALGERGMRQALVEGGPGRSPSLRMQTSSTSCASRCRRVSWPATAPGFSRARSCPSRSSRASPSSLKKTGSCS